MQIDDVLQLAPPGTAIPKPNARGKFLVKGIGMRRGERALIYTIPGAKDLHTHYEKGLTERELEAAYDTLIASGALTRQWFKSNLPGAEAEGACNFTTVGGLFTLLGIATYERYGVYRRTTTLPTLTQASSGT